MKKYLIVVLLAVVIGLIATHWKPSKRVEIDHCVEITDMMTVKEAREIEAICNQKIEQLQQERQALEDQQTELSQKADTYRKLLANSPFTKLRNEPKLAQVTPGWLQIK